MSGNRYELPPELRRYVRDCARLADKLEEEPQRQWSDLEWFNELNRLLVGVFKATLDLERAADETGYRHIGVAAAELEGLLYAFFGDEALDGVVDGRIGPSALRKVRLKLQEDDPEGHEKRRSALVAALRSVGERLKPVTPANQANARGDLETVVEPAEAHASGALHGDSVAAPPTSVGGGPPGRRQDLTRSQRESLLRSGYRFLLRGGRVEYLRKHYPALFADRTPSGTTLRRYGRDQLKWKWDNERQGWWIPPGEPEP